MKSLCRHLTSDSVICEYSWATSLWQKHSIVKGRGGGVNGDGSAPLTAPLFKSRLLRICRAFVRRTRQRRIWTSVTHLVGQSFFGLLGAPLKGKKDVCCPLTLAQVACITPLVPDKRTRIQGRVQQQDDCLLGGCESAWAARLRLCSVEAFTR